MDRTGSAAPTSVWRPGRSPTPLESTVPQATVDTACSSGMLAVHLACRSLHGGDSDLAFAGGACVILDPRKFASGSAQGVLSPRAVSVGGFGWSAVHNVCVGGLGWVADAPEVPSSHRL